MPKTHATGSLLWKRDLCRGYQLRMLSLTECSLGSVVKRRDLMELKRGPRQKWRLGWALAPLNSWKKEEQMIPASQVSLLTST